MTMGGNDLRFGDIVRKCYWGGALGQRDETECRNLIEDGLSMVDDGELTDKFARRCACSESV